MANHLTVPVTDDRSSMTRTRSSSSPFRPAKDDSTQPASRPPRPSHVRSHSWMSPTGSKPPPAGAATFPSVGPDKSEVSRFHRLHLPGRHHHHHSSVTEDPKGTSRTHHGRHKYTQSESQQHHRKRDSALPYIDSPGTPLSTATPSSTSEQLNDLLYPSSRGTAIPSLMRMASTRSHRVQPSGDLGTEQKSGLRGRATSDVRYPNQDGTQGPKRPPKTPIELQLEHADQSRRMALENTTEDDIKRLDKQLKAATGELQDRLTSTTRNASELMRRLDDAQETLSRTTESLVDTISSFSNLFDQSSQLISSFEHESHHFDSDTRKRIARFRNSISKIRGKRVDELEQRGKAMSQKAQDLERRLENCRTIVNNWEERETSKRRAWRGVWVGMVWGVALIVVAVLAGIISWKAVEIGEEKGTALSKLRQMTVHNKSYDANLLQTLDVPDDVREVLLDIETRVRERRPLEHPSVDEAVLTKVDCQEDTPFRLLDEL